MTARLLHGPGLVVPAGAIAVVLALASWRAPTAALLAAGAATLLALAVFRADLLLLVLTAALPWEGMLAFPTETITAVKVLGLLLFAGYVLRLIAQREELRLPLTLGAAIALGLLVGASLVVSADPAAGLGKALRYALFITFFFLVVQLVRDRREVVRALQVITLSSSFAAVVGMVTFLGSGATRAGRARGPIADPNDFAYLLASVLPLAAFLAANDRKRRWLWLTACGLLLGGTLATLSRGALVGLAALALWAVVTRRIPLHRLGAALAAAGLALFLAFAFFGPLIDEKLDQKGKVASSNVHSRASYWESALRSAAAHPVFGVGPGRFGDETDDRLPDSPVGAVAGQELVVHNSYLEILAENGVFALGAFVAFLAGTWWMLHQARREHLEHGDTEGANLATAMQATLVVAIVSGAFLSEQLTIPFWLIGALATAAGRPRAVPARRETSTLRPATA